MKKLFATFLLIFLTGCTPRSLGEVGPSPSPSPQLKTITVNNQTYSYAYVIIDNLSRLKLLPNHSQKLSSRELIIRHHCQILVNGNFYDKSNQPLGWLVSNNETISKSISSQLFNGYLSISGSQAKISYSLPEHKVDFGLQSGPLLIFDSKPLLLKINQDLPRRRIISAVTENNQLVFIAITSARLSDTPALVNLIADKINQPIQAAINLDGGSASAFITPEVALPESSSIGSFFCYTEL